MTVSCQRLHLPSGPSRTQSVCPRREQADDYSLPGNDSAITAVIEGLSSKWKLDQRAFQTTIQMVSDDGEVIGTHPGIGLSF